MKNTVSFSQWMLRLFVIPITLIFTLSEFQSIRVAAQIVDRVTDIEWNCTGDFIATVSRQGTVTVFDAATNQPLLVLEGYGFDADIAWHPMEPTQLAVSSVSGEPGVTIIDISNGNTVAQFSRHYYTYSVSFSPDGRYIVVSHSTVGGGPSQMGYISVIEIATGNEPVTFEQVYQRVVSGLWQPGGNLIAGLNIGYESSEVVLWDFNTGDVVSRLSEAEIIESEVGEITIGTIGYFAWRPDGEQIITSDSWQATFWDVSTFSKMYESEILSINGDLAWNPVKETLAIPDDLGNQIQIVSSMGKIIAVIDTDSDVRTVNWSPDGSQIAYGDAAQGTFETLQVDITEPYNLRLEARCSPDPDRIRIWDVRNPNLEAIDFTWKVMGTDQTGSGTVPAGTQSNSGWLKFETQTIPDVPNTVRIWVDGEQHDQEDSSPCQSSTSG